MDDKPRSRRVYGSLVGRTANITEAPILAGYLRVMLRRLAGYDRVPENVVFTLLVRGEDDDIPTIRVLVHGLTDQFLTKGTNDQSIEAMYVEGAVRSLVSTLDWDNPEDPADHRFHYDVALLTEEQQEYSIFPPGEVWVTSLEPTTLHMPYPW
jgi:hypothetical protein